VATESRTGVVVDVVLNEGNVGQEMEFLERLLEKDFADLVIGDDIGEREALRRAILDVAHVEIEAAAVEEETAIARGLVVVAVVKIDQPELFLFEDIIANARGDGGKPERFGSHTAVLGFQTGEPLHAITLPGIWREATGKVRCQTESFSSSMPVGAGRNSCHLIVTD